MNTPKVGRTKQARLAKLTLAERFFYEHAGYNYDPKTETKQQGRIRCAKSLALAEEQASNLGWDARWLDDWDIGSHVWEFGEESYPNEPSTCESCQLWDTEGIRCLASVGCVDDADANYRRVIEAELASEAMHDYDRETETLDAH